MLKVTDISRLKEYGFEKRGKNHSGRDIWTLDIEEGPFEVSLTVNPLKNDSPEVENEIEFWGSMDVAYKDGEQDFKHHGYTNIVFDIPCEQLCRMIADGVIVIENKVKAVA